MKLFKSSLYLLLIAFVTFSCSEDPQVPTTPGQTAPDANKTITDLKALVTGQDAYEVPANFVFKAIVISNQGESNNFYQSLFVQSGESGLKISCNKDSYYATLEQGQEITIIADGLYVAKSYDTFVLGYGQDENYKVGLIPADVLSEVAIAGATGNNVTPDEINDLSTLTTDMVGTWVKVTNIQVIESQIDNVMADGNSSYGTITMTDADGKTIQISTNKYANFASDVIPSGSGSVTGILGTYAGNYQITLTSTSDLDLTGDRFDVNNPNAGDNDICGSQDSPLDGIYEAFSNVTNNTDFEEVGWLNVIEEGERRWQGKYFDGDNNYYVQATAHNAAEGTHSMWLITPPLNVDNATSKILRFKTAQAYFQASTTFEVFILQCINNETIETKLNPVLANPDNQANYEFVSSGDIDLSSYSGTVHIGFHYSGQGGSGNSTTWCIDDVEFNNTETSVEFSSSPVTVVDSESDYSYSISTSVSNAAGATTITASGQPSWLNITDNGDGTAILAGTAPSVSENETHNIVLTATNNGVSVNQEFTLIVKAPVQAGSNLLINPDFEDWNDDNTPTGWTKAEIVTKESSTIKSGSFSAKHFGDGATKDIAQTIDIKAGSTYEVTIWYNVESGDDTDARLWCNYINESGSADYDNTPIEIRDADSYLDSGNYNEWKSYTATFTVPAGISKLNFEIRTYNGSTVYWDNLSVVEK